MNTHVPVFLSKNDQNDDNEVWKESVRNPSTWISSADINKEIADLVYGKYKSGIEYRGHIIMLYGLALECHLKANAIKNGIIAVNKTKVQLNDKFKSHDLIYFYTYLFRAADDETKNYLEKIRRGVESGKYPFEKKPSKDNYKVEIDKIVSFCLNLIKKLKIEFKESHMILTKTDYMLLRECSKNAWYKIHKPDIYFQSELTEFEKHIIETGNEVELVARQLFPRGVLVEGRDEAAQELTQEYITKKQGAIFQPVFETEKYKTACDILLWNEAMKGYDLCEVKASNGGEDKKQKDNLYAHDLAFQAIVLKELGVPLNRLFLIRLNQQYTRGAELDLQQLFTKEDFTDRVMKIENETRDEMAKAFDYLSSDKEPFGSCACITKGRSAHCTTFAYSNPNVPEYSVHDISRIGLSKKKLEALIDSGIFDIHKVPEDFELSDIQRNQVNAAQLKKLSVVQSEVRKFLGEIKFPISFLDYETFPCAIPRFRGYRPFDQIPFQFSLYILDAADKELRHNEFIFTDKTNPDETFIGALKKYLPASDSTGSPQAGSIIVWNKRFEMGINTKLGERYPEDAAFLSAVNARAVDLEDVFKKQHFIHPGFKGKTSIKSILPTLVPELSYKGLEIREGGAASDTWNRIVSGEYSEQEASEKIKNLKEYCKLDTYAMFAIWTTLRNSVK